MVGAPHRGRPQRQQAAAAAELLLAGLLLLAWASSAASQNEPPVRDTARAERPRLLQQVQRGVAPRVPLPAAGSRVFAACPTYCAENACVRQSTAGGYVCNQCAATFTLANGDCVCAPGTYFSSGECKPCEVGKYCPGGSSSAGQTACAGPGLTTVGTGAESVQDCVNDAGYSYVSSSSAAQCAAGTYSSGKQYQTACSPCSGGFTTPSAGAQSASSCELKPGYYLKSPGMAAACPKGYYYAGGALASSCTACAAGVTTAGPGSGSANDCNLLEPGFQASGKDGVRITATAACDWDSYCPGTTTSNTSLAHGKVACGTGLRTRQTGSVSPTQCVAPPGYKVSGNTAVTCDNGEYKEGWGNVTSCTSCGTNMQSATGTSVAVAGGASINVRGSPNDCFILAGQGLYMQQTSNGAVFEARECALEGLDCGGGRTCDQWGVAAAAYGLNLSPCKWCLRVNASAPAATTPRNGSESTGNTVCNPT